METKYELKNAIVKFGVTDEITWNEVEKIVDKYCEKQESKFDTSIRLLRDLVKLQNIRYSYNGSPLEQYKIEFEKTMNEVFTFLNKHEPTTNN